MSKHESDEPLLDAETDFRRRLAVKLRARGYEGAAMEARIEELIRMEFGLRLNIDEIMGK